MEVNRDKDLWVGEILGLHINIQLGTGFYMTQTKKLVHDHENKGAASYNSMQ